MRWNIGRVWFSFIRPWGVAFAPLPLLHVFSDEFRIGIGVQWLNRYVALERFKAK